MGSNDFSNMFNNWQQNQYNQQMQDWQYQNQQNQNQYQYDMDYWNQMRQYDNNQANFDNWSSGADRVAPIVPRQAPQQPGWQPRPFEPEQLNLSGFGNFGGGGQGSSQAPSWIQSTPGAFEGSSYVGQDPFSGHLDTTGVVDPSAAIASAQPGIMENMNKAFADAGNRFGSSGMVGTPYAGALGDASRGASNDIANITNQYTFQANSDAANRQQAAAIAQYQGELDAWGQAGQWGHEGQLAGMNQDFNAWAQAGDWQNQNNMGQNMFNQQNWQTQGGWDQQNQYNQQQQMMQMMQMMMGGGGY